MRQERSDLKKPEPIRYRVVSADGKRWGALDDGGEAYEARSKPEPVDRSDAYSIMADLIAQDDAEATDKGWCIVRVKKISRPKTKHLGYAVIPKLYVVSLEAAREEMAELPNDEDEILVEVRVALDGETLLSDPPAR
jgi:hypothetical protein